MMRSSLLVSMCVLLLAGSGGCRGEEDEACHTSMHADVAGTWELEMLVTSHCEPENIGEEFVDEVTVTQSGSRVTVEIDGYVLVSELTGSICADDFSASGSASEEIMGCSGRENVSVSGTVHGEGVTGQVSWSQNVNDPEACMGLISCSGSNTFTGTRITP